MRGKSGPQPGSRFRTYAAPESEWAEDAACQGMAPAFDAPLPGETAEQTDARVADALAVCGVCRVRMACRDWTMDQPRKDRQGVMGGQFWPIVNPYPATKKSAA